MEKKRREIVKMEENLKWKRKGMENENEQRTFSFFFFFVLFCFVLFFCLSLFETTEICLGCTKMEISAGKKIGKGEIF